MKKLISVSVVLVVLLFIVFSCAKENEQELGAGFTCETSNMSYTKSIQPILESFCYDCHGRGLSQNGINFDTYTGVKTVADNGKLVGAISHSSGFVAMHKSAPRLSDCNIKKIK